MPIINVESIKKNISQFSIIPRKNVTLEYKETLDWMPKKDPIFKSVNGHKYEISLQRDQILITPKIYDLFSLIYMYQPIRWIYAIGSFLQYSDHKVLSLDIRLNSIGEIFVYGSLCVTFLTIIISLAINIGAGILVSVVVLLIVWILRCQIRKIFNTFSSDLTEDINYF